VEAVATRVVEKKVSSLNTKISELPQMIQQVETANFRAVAAIESSTNKRFSAFEQMLRQSEAALSQSLVATEAAMDTKTIVLEKLIQKAAEFENKLQAIESLESSVDKKMGALEMLARKAEALKSAEGASKQHYEIFSLRQKGLKTKDIGEVLDMPLGEVELILALLPQKREEILTREGNFFCDPRKMLSNNSVVETRRAGGTI